MSVIITTTARHMPYPHIAGYVYDCDGCLAKCFCKPAEGVCAHCTAKAPQWPSQVVVAPDEDTDADECEGHESLNGADMGRSVFCDGSCQG